MRFLPRLIGISISIATFLTAVPALGVDGAIEINQARATIGGVSGGDSPGFPVSITESGKYRLTGNLTVNEATTAIVVNADNVTLDLNGFSIIGPVNCSFASTSCTPAGVAGTYGIHATAGDNLVIKNGSVTGTGGAAVYCGNTDSCVVEHLNITDNYSIGIVLGQRGRVSNCNISSNKGSGISSGQSAIIENNIIQGNGSRGLLVRLGGVIATSNVFFRNATTEIDMNSKTVAIGGNTFSPRVSGNWFDNYSKMTEISSNLCIDSSPPPHTNCTGL